MSVFQSRLDQMMVTSTRTRARHCFAWMPHVIVANFNEYKQDGRGPIDPVGRYPKTEIKDKMVCLGAILCMISTVVLSETDGRRYVIDSEPAPLGRQMCRTGIICGPIVSH